MDAACVQVRIRFATALKILGQGESPKDQPSGLTWTIRSPPRVANTVWKKTAQRNLTFFGCEVLLSETFGRQL